MAERKRYCPKCGNTGLDIDGNVCTCRFNESLFFDTVICTDVPEQYQGINFNKFLLPNDVPANIADFMQSIYDGVRGMSWKMHNVLLATPTATGKSILAYSCLELLCRAKQRTFPVMDVLELKRIVTDMDLGKKQVYDIDNPERIFSVELLFAKIPRVRTLEVYDFVPLLLDRRVRRGLSTIFLYDGSWADLINRDYFGAISNLQGDGRFNTLDVQTWFSKRNVQETLPDINVEENKG